MVKVFIYPTNSLILADLVKRAGHEPLVVMNQVRDKVTTLGVDSPPLNITAEEPKTGLKYAAIEVPAGVRGRMSLMGPLTEQADIAIIVDGAPADFGCSGCNRTNELTKFLVRDRLNRNDILEIRYPETDDQTYTFVYQILEFLKKYDTAETADAAGADKAEDTSGREAKA
ncbi:methanogenesis marker 5 protein [Methanosarcinaceae archaeon]|nr:methanogenesis marker 5 protein [Methanosarcinaceae archaeon]MBQ3620147.1 methanogenesis marker 5 protein [Methanosarcinaceae archaeon]